LLPKVVEAELEMALLVILGDPGRGGGSRRDCFSGDLDGSGKCILNVTIYPSEVLYYYAQPGSGFPRSGVFYMATGIDRQAQVETNPDEHHREI
jgi:hypothetical protein